MPNLFLDSLIRLKQYCEAEGYKGWDPYDGLNSKVFQAFPFIRNSATCRLVMIQGMKRCPINLRRLLKVPKEYNPKGLGLLLQGYCNLMKVVMAYPGLNASLGGEAELKGKIVGIADLLLDMQSKGDYHGACWGYNFDWQARKLFLFPRYTPNVVVTSFCATALMDAYEITKNKKYLYVALSSAEFIKEDLNRTECQEGVLISYSPLKGNDTVYNASLMGSRLLSYCYKYTCNEDNKYLAGELVRACCAEQREDGAWMYGRLSVQNWVDSFHTGYNLDGLIAYEELTGDARYHSNIERGLKYYISNFFSPDGMPKYYDSTMYPIDIHCPGQLLVSLSRLHKYNDFGVLADKVLNWTIHNMQDKKGFFYYQLKKGISSKISYMRWSNAFMFYSMSYYLLETYQKKMLTNVDT